MGACHSKKGDKSMEPQAQAMPLKPNFDKKCPSALTDELFKKYDKNQNGVLETSEIALLFKEVFPEWDGTQADVENVMASLDLNQDGTVGLNELRAFLRVYNPETSQIQGKSALVIIDVQNDFISGTLAVPKSPEIVPTINSMRDKFDFVVISYDWHPQEHCSFVESVNAGKVPIKEELKEFTPFSMITLAADAERPEHEQCLYPRHCVQDSDGAKCHPDLVVKPTDPAVYKGIKPNIDSYSAFYDNMKLNDVGLAKILNDAGITHVYCCGLVFDICVKSSALHGAELGFKTTVIEDACTPLNADAVGPTKELLAKAGVSIMSTADAVAEATEIRTSLKFNDYFAHIKKAKTAKSVHDEIEKSANAHK